MTAKDKHAEPAPTDAPVESDAPPTQDSETPVPDSISVEELEALKAKAAKADENWDTLTG